MKAIMIIYSIHSIYFKSPSTALYTGS